MLIPEPIQNESSLLISNSGPRLRHYTYAVLDTQKDKFVLQDDVLAVAAARKVEVSARVLSVRKYGLDSQP